MRCSRFVCRWQILLLLTQRFSWYFADGTLEREREEEFRALSIALICSLVSVEGFNFPGTTKSVFLFRRFSRQHCAGIQKRVDSNTPTKSTCRCDAPPPPSHAFVLRFFFLRCLSVIDFAFIFSFSSPD